MNLQEKKIIKDFVERRISAKKKELKKSASEREEAYLKFPPPKLQALLDVWEEHTNKATEAKDRLREMGLYPNNTDEGAELRSYNYSLTPDKYRSISKETNQKIRELRELEEKIILELYIDTVDSKAVMDKLEKALSRF